MQERLNDKGHERYVELSQRLNSVSNAAALAITLCVVAASATSVSRCVLAFVVCAGMFVFNLAVNRYVVPRSGARGDVWRMVANGLLAALAYNLIDWPLPVWLWLPFIAITFNQARGSRFVLWMVLLLSGIQGAAALLSGERLLEPFVFTAFAIGCWAISGARYRIVESMLDSAEAQRDELARAHEQLVVEVAARERAELELRQAQKLEALGRLAAGIAHEINTPMQFIQNSVQFLREGVADLLAVDSDVDREYLGAHLPEALALASEGCQRVASIVRSMKQFEHADGGCLPVDINDAIETTLAITRHEYSHVADVARDFATMPRVTCNVAEVTQTLLNLITNAAYAIERTGRRGAITIATRVDASGALISVADDGTGIPESIRERVFEPFFTTKDVGRGTGQGLSISRAMIERHGGELSFESSGRGTTFYIRLPLAA